MPEAADICSWVPIRSLDRPLRIMSDQSETSFLPYLWAFWGSE